MRGKMKKYLHIENYLNRARKLFKTLKILRLKNKKVQESLFINLWEIPIGHDSAITDVDVKVSAFGIELEKEDLNWLKDIPGDFTFPSRRIDKIKISPFVNKGVDIKFPWELSRFAFGNQLASMYVQSGDIKYYFRFRELVLHWIENNPFLMGLNWHCTMDNAIRATNWILAASVFYNEIKMDDEFHKRFSRSLVEHAMHIDTFPEIYKGNHTTNHTTADYLGLLYLSRALANHPDASHWQIKAKIGLHRCMEYQVYQDGGSFEASSGYQRLVIEFFGLGALLCSRHGLNLEEAFINSLHNMFDFMFSITDDKGHVPRFGDNDSASLLQFEYSLNEDYSYLQGLYQVLFEEGYSSRTSNKKYSFMHILPVSGNRHLNAPKTLIQKKDMIRHFKESGLVAFRNKRISGTVLFLQLGQNGQGGHNHFDVGSFTLSYAGEPILVDPGIHSYLRSLAIRNKYRSYLQHNTVIQECIEGKDFPADRYFELDPYFKLQDCVVKDKQKRIILNYRLLLANSSIKRTFSFDETTFTVSDEASGSIKSRFHFSPGVSIIEMQPGLIQTNLFSMKFNSRQKYSTESYSYAGRYQVEEESTVVTVFAKDHSRVRIELIIE